MNALPMSKVRYTHAISSVEIKSPLPMMTRFFSYAILVISSLLLSACFSPADEVAVEDGLHQITINVNSFNKIPFTRAYGAGSVTHLDLAFFDSENKRVVKVNQVNTDADFLHPAITVPKGDLKLVIIAHSGKGVATITSPTEVTFPNNKVTDTFTYYDTFTISDDTPASIDINLDRKVAMIRLIVNDTELPANFAQLKFYYTGGSSTFNPLSGLGSVNSRQTEIRLRADAVIDADGNHVFEVYTFPHVFEDEVKLTLTPQDSEGNAIHSDFVIDGIPVSPNYITECQGSIFRSNAFNITISDAWIDIKHYDF